VILEHCRRHGIWIFADDAYERLYYGLGGVAPSFLALAEDADRLVSANTFSKSWLMTGWRLGWLVVPPGLSADLGKLIEYNTSCAPVFVQRAGISAYQTAISAYKPNKHGAVRVTVFFVQPRVFSNFRYERIS
jgi:aspartate/methionine/tyrosine aminotransferase